MLICQSFVSTGCDKKSVFHLWVQGVQSHGHPTASETQTSGLFPHVFTYGGMLCVISNHRFETINMALLWMQKSTWIIFLCVHLRMDQVSTKINYVGDHFFRKTQRSTWIYHRTSRYQIEYYFFVLEGLDINIDIQLLWNYLFPRSHLKEMLHLKDNTPRDQHGP